METPYLDREIKILEEGLKDKTNSFYQNRKLVEYKEIKKQLALLRVSQQRELLKFWLKYSDDDLGMTEKQENEYIDKCIENFNCG